MALGVGLLTPPQSRPQVSRCTNLAPAGLLTPPRHDRRSPGAAMPLDRGVPPGFLGSSWAGPAGSFPRRPPRGLK